MPMPSGHLRQALRRLRKQPWFFAATTLALALGVGAVTIGFSVVQTLVLRPLPLSEPDALVVLSEIDGSGRSRGGSFAALEAWQSETQSFLGVAGYRLHDLNLTSQDRPAALMAASVTGGFFELLRQKVSLGRLFAVEEANAGSPVVVLSHRFWRSRFGERESAVGETISLANRDHTIIGVLPSDFRFLEHVPDVVLPLSSRPRVSEAALRSNLPIVIARLRQGAELSHADSVARRSIEDLSSQFPQQRLGWTASVESLHSRWMGDTGRPALLLFAAVVMLLLVACNSGAGLVLARGIRRKQEIAIRGALGATNGDIAKGFVAEAAVFTLASSLAGLTFAYIGLDALVSLIPPEVIGLVPGGSSGFRVDLLGAGFAVAISGLTTLLCCGSPLLGLSRSPLTAVLSSAGTSTAGGDYRGRAALMVGQVALSVVLLVSGGLLLKGYWIAEHTQTGFDAQNLMSLWIGLPESRYEDAASRGALYERVTQELYALPQVEAATAVDLLPSHEDQQLAPFAAPNAQTADTGQWPQAAARMIADSYFAAMRVPLLQGRAFDSRDSSDGPPVVIVSSSLANSYFAGEAIGSRIQLLDSSSTPMMAQIVGVVADVRVPLQRGSTDVVYRPIRQAPPDMVYFVVRTDHVEDVAASARQILWNLDPMQPIDGPWMADSLMAERLAIHRFSSSIVSAFAVAALSLAGLGVYGVIWSFVSSRRREIGIRLAVGASPGKIVRLVLAKGLALVAGGLVTGVASAMVLSSALEPYLLGVSRFDSAAYLGVVIVVLSIAVLASAIPARYAASLNPISTLRLD